MEEAVLVAVNDLRRPALDPIASFLTEWGLYAFPLALALAFAVARTRERARHLRDGGLAILFSLFLVEAIVKPLVHRTRPSSIESVAAHLHVLGAAPSSPSFPSGTATTCAAGATWLALRFGPRVGALAWALAVLISLTRLYVGVHWPTDVLAGWILGIAVAVGVDRFTRWAGDAGQQQTKPTSSRQLPEEQRSRQR